MAPQKFRRMKKFLHNTLKFNEHYCLKISTNKAPSAGNTPVRIMLLIIKQAYVWVELKMLVPTFEVHVDQGYI